MKRYSRRPIEVEVMRVATPFKAVAEWSGGRVCVGFSNRVVGVSIANLQVINDSRHRGRDIAYRGEWIVKTPSGYQALSDEDFQVEYVEVTP